MAPNLEADCLKEDLREDSQTSCGSDDEDSGVDSRLWEEGSLMWSIMVMGEHLSDHEDPAVLIDVGRDDFPIIGVSAGFERLVGYESHQLVSASLNVLQSGIPAEYLSRSSAKNLRSFLAFCRLGGARPEWRRGRLGMAIGDVHVMQPCRRGNGSVFMASHLYSFVHLGGKPYVLCVLAELGDGPAPILEAEEVERIQEESRATGHCIRRRLRRRVDQCNKYGESGTRASSEDSASDSHSHDSLCALSSFFFEQRLEEQCILLDGGLTAMRRDPSELHTGCLVFGWSPLEIARSTLGHHSHLLKDAYWLPRSLAPGGLPSLNFAVQVGGITPDFHGLPLMGFTRREPSTSASCYPSQAQCMGASVSIGRLGEAFARDQWDHTEIGFVYPPPSELQKWSAVEDSRGASFPVSCGDMLECRWTIDGCLALLQNGNCILSLNVQRRPELGVNYYPFIDVCFSVTRVTCRGLPNMPPGLGSSSDAGPGDALRGLDVRYL